MKRPYSLRKSRNILKWVYGWYKKNSHKLSPTQLNTIESEMAALDQALWTINEQKPMNALAVLKSLPTNIVKNQYLITSKNLFLLLHLL